MKMIALLVVMAAVLFPVGLLAEPAGPAPSTDGAGNKSSKSPDAPPIEEIVSKALEQSPALAAQRAKISSLHEQVGPAGALSDPMIELNAEESFMPSPAFSKGTLEFRQELPFPGKLESRRKAASADASRQVAELKKAERKLVSDVRTTYAKIYALDQERKYLDVAKDLLKLISETASARYSAGEGDQEALIKSQLAVSQLYERQQNLQAERRELVAEMNRLLNQPGDQPLGEVTKLPEVKAPVKDTEESVLNTPDVATQNAAVMAAERRLDSARKEVYPDFLVGLGGGVARNYVNNTQMPMAMLKFGVTLPIWQKSKQRPMIRAAEYEWKMAAEEQRDTEAMVRSEFTRLQSEWQKNEKLIVLYKQAILPQTDAALSAARSSYLTGRGVFITVIEDFNMWLESRIELARRESERFTTWAELESLRPVKSDI